MTGQDQWRRCNRFQRLCSLASAVLGKRFCAEFGSFSPSHGENRGSIPLGSANKINNLFGLGSISVPKVSPTIARRPSCL